MKRTLSLFLLLALLWAIGAPGALAEEPGEVRHIVTVEDLEKLAADCRLDSYSVGLQVVLDTDLDLSETALHPIPSFSGSFDGQGHTLSGLRLATDGSHQGLFRYIQQGGTVKDLHLTGELAPENGQCQLGCLAGVNYGTVTGCSFEGKVSGLNSVGGLIGENYGTVRDCTASGKVEGKRSTGGIAGLNEGMIVGCSNYAQINTSINEAGLQLEDLAVPTIGNLDLTNAEDQNVVSDSGGIVGFSTGVVQGCINYATVGYPHYGYNVGGVAGRQSGYLTLCENYGEIYGRKDVAGIVGQMEPFLVLKESVNLLEELRLLNALMNRASGTMGTMSEEMQSTLDSLDQSSSSAGSKLGGGGSISHVGPDSADNAGSIAPSGGNIAPSGGGSISGGSGVTDQDLQDGLDYLDDNTKIDTDDVTVPEGLSGDVNDMASGMSEMYDIIGTNTGELSGELTDVNNQLSRVLMLMANALNGASNRQFFEDVSDSLDEKDVEGRVSRSINYGAVDGDQNVGGVIGDMGIEYEFDMEGKLAQVIGAEGIVSNTYETKCVSSDNVNRGSVTGRKDDVGGIAGLGELGTVLRCEGYGPVSSSDGGYVGGVIGCSHSVVRESYAMCDISGKEYVGGIAGYGTTIADCTSMVGLRDVTACGGAIAGWADMDGETVSGNRFVHETLGAVDGISYTGKAVPVSYEELLQQKGLPQQFSTLHVSFVADGAVVGEIEFEYGGSIDPSQIPQAPEKEGFTGTWPDYDFSALYYSVVLEAVYTPRQGALAAKQNREDSPMAIVLIEGDFDTTTTISLNEFSGDEPIVDGGTVREKWVAHLSELEEGQTYSLRYLPPEVGRGHRIDLYVRAEGRWTKVETGKAGSYMSFDCDKDTVVFSAVEVSSASPKALVLIGAVTVAVLGVGFVLLRSRKKKTPAESKDA